MLSRLQFHFSPPDEDSLVVTPAVVITRARNEDNGAPANAFMLQIEWLIWGVAVSLDLS